MNKIHIKDLHKTCGKTHKYVAQQIGIARSTYTKILNGMQYPSYPVSRKIADFFQVPLDIIEFGPYRKNSHRKSRR